MPVNDVTSLWPFVVDQGCAVFPSGHSAGIGTGKRGCVDCRAWQRPMGRGCPQRLVGHRVVRVMYDLLVSVEVGYGGGACVGGWVGGCGWVTALP